MGKRGVRWMGAIFVLVVLTAICALRWSGADAPPWLTAPPTGLGRPERHALLGSLGLAAASTVLALLLAFPVGLRVGKSRSRMLLAAAILPLLIPPQVAAYVWRFLLQDLAGRAGVGDAWAQSSACSFIGGAWTLAAIYWPVICLPIAASMRLTGNRLEQELAVAAPPRAVFWRAVVPGLAPGLVAGVGVFFLLALSNYGVPLMWDIPSRNIAVFAQLTASLDPKAVFSLALPLQAAAVVLCCAGVIWLGRKSYAADRTQAEVPPAAATGADFGAPALLTSVVLTATAAVPIAALLLGRDLSEMVKPDLIAGSEPFGWGAAIAAIGATGAAGAGLALSQLVPVRARGWTTAVEIVGLLTLLSPAAMICAALAAGLDRSSWAAAIHSSLWIFLLAYGVRFFYIPWKILCAARRLEAPEHSEIARLAGLGFLRRAWLSIAGALRPALCVSWLLVFALAFGEQEISSFFAQPGRQPLSVFMDNLMHHGRSSAAAKWSLIAIVMNVAVAVIVAQVGARRGLEGRPAELKVRLQ